MAHLFPGPSVVEEGSVGLQIDTVKLHMSGRYTDTRPFRHQCKLGAAPWSPFVSLEEVESDLGQLLPSSPKETPNFSPAWSRVRRLPVARTLSGSNRILKGFLTRKTGMKKIYCTCSFGEQFSRVALYALCLRILTDQGD